MVPHQMMESEDDDYKDQIEVEEHNNLKVEAEIEIWYCRAWGLPE